MKARLIKLIAMLILTGSVITGCERRYYEGENHDRREHRHHRDHDDYNRRDRDHRDDN